MVVSLAVGAISSLPSHVLAAIPLATVVIYFVSLVIYRLYFHPLAKYPGPLLAKLTRFYATYHAMVGDVHWDMYECHRKYGKFVRYSPNRIIVSSSLGLRDVYAHGKHLRKSSSYLSVAENPDFPASIALVDKTEHGRKRRLLSQGLSDAALRGYEDKMLERISTFCEQLGTGASEESKGWSSPKNMSHWTNYLSFDVMAMAIFGKPFNMLEDEKTRYIPDVIDGAARRTGILNQLPGLYTPFYNWKKRLFDLLMTNEIKENRAKFGVLAMGLFSERMKAGAEQKGDVMTHMLNFLGSKDPKTGKPYTVADVISEARLLIVAGSDTSSTAMSAAFYHLCNTPGALQRLQKEVRGTFNSADEIVSGQKLNSCAYLRACIDEAMRLSPPVGGAMWREAQESGVYVDGEYFPGGTDLGVGIYSLHHEEEFFPEPFAFRPERWLANEWVGGPKEVEKAKTAFSAFSIGPRGCTGKGLAMMELMLSIARAVYIYDWRRIEGDDEICTRWVEHNGQKYREFRLLDQFTSLKTGPYVEFSRANGELTES